MSERVTGMTLCGKCRPGAWFGCSIPLGSADLALLLDISLRQPKFEFLSLVSPAAPALPAGGLDLMDQALFDPDQRLGLLHAVESNHVFVQTATVRHVIAAGKFAIGQEYAQLVNAIRSEGWQVTDIRFILGQ